MSGLNDMSFVSILMGAVFMLASSFIGYLMNNLMSSRTSHLHQRTEHEKIIDKLDCVIHELKRKGGDKDDGIN